MMRRFLQLALGVAGVGLLALLAPRLYTAFRYQPRIYPASEVPSHRVAIVFGAGLRRDGRPTPVLYDRVLTAAELFHAGKVDRLLLSGDNRFVGYDEPAAMAATARDLGVPDDALVLDYAGRRTYDTCYRARVIFGVTDAILVTQAFHLPRALFLCDALGIESVGASADQRYYLKRSRLIWNLREVLATAAAWWDVVVAKPLPVLGEPIPIE